MLVLTHSQIASLLHTLTPAEHTRLVAALTAALTTFSTTPHLVSQPLRTSLKPAPLATTTLVMPSALAPTAAIKSVSLAPHSPPRGALTLLDAATGTVLALLSAEELTAFRTAAVSLLLLPAAARSVVVFGAGRQAAWAVRLLLRRRHRGVHVAVVARGDARARLPADLEFAVVPEGDVRAALEAADAVFCCTPSCEPLFPMRWVTPRTKYVSLIGSYRPDMVEVEPGLLRREGVRVVVDSVEACLVEAGEVVEAGLGREDMVELGDVLAGEDEWDGLCVFKCVGLGVMDLAVGKGVVEIAEERGMGVRIDGFDG